MLPMTMIRNASSIQDRLVWALAESDRINERHDEPLRDVILSHLLPSMDQYDPVELVQIGMRAVLRDLQEWLNEYVGEPVDPQTNESNEQLIDSRVLRSWILALLVTAGGVETPLV